jgi:hypothetical protein
VARAGLQDLVDGRDDHFGHSVDGLGHRAGCVAELAGDLRCRQASQYLGVVLGAGQDVAIPDVEEGDGPGLVDAVDLGRYVVSGQKTGVQRGLRLQRMTDVIGQLGGAEAHFPRFSLGLSRGFSRWPSFFG